MRSGRGRAPSPPAARHRAPAGVVAASRAAPREERLLLFLYVVPDALHHDGDLGIEPFVGRIEVLELAQDSFTTWSSSSASSTSASASSTSSRTRGRRPAPRSRRAATALRSSCGRVSALTVASSQAFWSRRKAAARRGGTASTPRSVAPRRPIDRSRDESPSCGARRPGRTRFAADGSLASSAPGLRRRGTLLGRLRPHSLLVVLRRRPTSYCGSLASSKASPSSSSSLFGI